MSTFLILRSHGTTPGERLQNITTSLLKSRRPTRTNAWLVTWDWCGRHAAVADRVAAILSSRKSEDSIMKFVEFLYLHATGYPEELAYYANRRHRIPYKAQRDHGCGITCGHNPWLHARLVMGLTVEEDPSTGLET